MIGVPTDHSGVGITDSVFDLLYWPDTRAAQSLISRPPYVFPPARDEGCYVSPVLGPWCMVYCVHQYARFGVRRLCRLAYDHSAGLVGRLLYT